MTAVTSSISMAENGLPLFNIANVDQIAGVTKRVRRATFDASTLPKERLRITNNGAGIYDDDEQVQIIGEAGTRLFTKGTGGSNSDNAAASNFNRCRLNEYLTLALAADTNAVLTTTGIPASGTGNDGDYAFDKGLGKVYLKTAGAWALSSTVALPLQAYTWASRPTSGSAGDRIMLTDYAPNQYVMASWDPGVGAIPADFQVGAPVYWVTGLVSGGVVDNTAAIVAAIENARFKTGARGAIVQFPSGEFACSNVAVPMNIKLRGNGTTRHSGTPAGTRLVQLAGTTLPILSVGATSTTSSRLWCAAIEQLTLYGNGLDTPLGLLYTHHCSYFNQQDITVTNTAGFGIRHAEIWDSWVTNTRALACGNSTGTRDSVWFGIESGDTDTTNQVYVRGLHCEAFPGVAMRVSGSNCGQIFVYGAKLESGTGNSLLPHLVLNGVVNIFLSQVDICGTAAASRLFQFDGCTGVRGVLSLKMAGSAIPVNYGWNKTSSQFKLHLLFYSTNPEPSGSFVIESDALTVRSGSIDTNKGFTAPMIDPAFGYYRFGVWNSPPQTWGATHTFAGLDYNTVATCTGAPTAITFAPSMGRDFQPSMRGVCTFTAVAGVTFNDNRTTTSGPWFCSLTQDSYVSGAEVYSIEGSKQ